MFLNKLLLKQSSKQVFLKHKISSPLLRTTCASNYFSTNIAKEENAVVLNGNSAALLKASQVPENFMEKFGLYDWKVNGPIALALAIPALSNGIYVINEETQLAACFVLFCTSVYKYGGDAIGSFFDARADAILAEHNAVEDSMIKNCNEILSQYHLQLNLMDDITALNKMHKEIVAVVCKVEIGKLKHEMRRLFIKNMDQTIMLQNNCTKKLQKDMVAYASTEVKKVLLGGSEEVKASAFDDALRILEKKGKPETDNVVALFKTNLRAYYDTLKAKDGTTIIMTDAEFDNVQKELEAYMGRVEMPELELKATKEYVYNLVD